MTAKLNRTDLRATIVAAIISTIIAVIAQFVASRSIALEFRRLEKLEETLQQSVDRPPAEVSRAAG